MTIPNTCQLLLIIITHNMSRWWTNWPISRLISLRFSSHWSRSHWWLGLPLRLPWRRLFGPTKLSLWLNSNSNNKRAAATITTTTTTCQSWKHWLLLIISVLHSNKTIHSLSSSMELRPVRSKGVVEELLLVQRRCKRHLFTIILPGAYCINVNELFYCHCISPIIHKFRVYIIDYWIISLPIEVNRNDPLFAWEKLDLLDRIITYIARTLWLFNSSKYIPPSVA